MVRDRCGGRRCSMWSFWGLFEKSLKPPPLSPRQSPPPFLLLNCVTAANLLQFPAAPRLRLRSKLATSASSYCCWPAAVHRLLTMVSLSLPAVLLTFATAQVIQLQGERNKETVADWRSQSPSVWERNDGEGSQARAWTQRLATATVTTGTSPTSLLQHLYYDRIIDVICFRLWCIIIFMQFLWNWCVLGILSCMSYWLIALSSGYHNMGLLKVIKVASDGYRMLLVECIQFLLEKT